jgi:hypothetical protein
MSRYSRKLKNCARIMLIVILWNFLIPFRGFADQPITQSENLTEGETRLWSDLEVDLLIDEISAAAYEAIEKAAAESAKAATMAGLEREALLLHEVMIHQADVMFWKLQAETNLLAVGEAKKAGRKNTVYAALFGVLGGLVVGIIGTFTIGR